MNLLSITRATVREPDQHYHDEHRTGFVRSVVMRQETTLLMVIVAIGAVATWKSDLFLTSDNLTEVLRSSVISFVVGCGAALLIVAAGWTSRPARCSRWAVWRRARCWCRRSRGRWRSSSASRAAAPSASPTT